MSENEAGKNIEDYGGDLEIERISFGNDGVDEAAADFATDDYGEAIDAAANADIPESEKTGGTIPVEVQKTPDDMVDASKFLREEPGNAETDGEDDIFAESTDGSGAETAAGKDKRVKKNVGKEILSWILTFVIAFLIAIVINAYFFRISTVSGDSMQQTFHDGQTVFLSRAPYIFSEPKYGDVVVFDHEQVHRTIFVEIEESLKYNIITMKLFKVNDSHKFWIKRVIGVPGDTIEIKEEGVYRNGVLLQEDYVNPAEIPNYSRHIGKWVVGEGQLFVMGDNRNHSSDSRVIGLITINSVLGKVLGQ